MADENGVVLYTTEPCGFCRQAKTLLQTRGAGRPDGPVDVPADRDRRAGDRRLPRAARGGPGRQARGPAGGVAPPPPPGRASCLRVVWQQLGRTLAGAALAAGAYVCAAARCPHLLDRRSAARTRLSLAQVDQEAVLERAAGAVHVAVVVDRGALRVDSGVQRLDDPLPQRLDLRPAQRPDGT